MSRRATIWLAGPLASGHLALAQPWPQFARTPQRVSTADALPSTLGAPRWITSHDSAGGVIAFAAQGGVVADRTRIFAIGRVGSQWSLYTLSANDGAALWSAPTPAPYVDSWSTPAIDATHNTVLVAAGHFLTAFDNVTGQPRWQASLARNVVDASPLIVSGTGSPARCFITDYDGFGGAAKLYCINLDALALGNPFQPGDIVWSVPIGGSSGNSAAVSQGVVFVASITDESGLSAGRILAFPAGATSPPPPLWTFTNPAGLGFFGGCVVSGNAVYAASYALTGGLLAANLVKVSAATGALLWSAPCNRTDSTPIPLPGGLIALSGGIFGFGSAPSVELFRDDGSAAALLWDSAQDTWTDANNNGAMDAGEFLAIGTWTFQPISAGTRLLAATPPATSSFGYGTDLYLLDFSHAPHEPGFVIDRASGPGATPAAAFGSIYSVGASGLYAFGAGDCYANCDESTVAPALNTGDFTCFLTRYAAGDPYANCDGSTTAPALNTGDFTCFLVRYAGGCP